MNVECQNCGTEYSLDETLVASTGTSVRCSKCTQVFKVFPKDGSKDSKDEWRVRQVSGHIIAFQRMGVLQQWISQEKLSQDDSLSRNNGPWKRIGDMPEMVAFFPKSPTIPPVSSGFPRTEPGEREPTISGAAPGESQVPEPVAPKEPTKNLRLMNSEAPMAQTVLAKTSVVQKRSTTIQPGPMPKEEIGDKPTKPMQPGPFVRPSTPVPAPKPTPKAQFGTAKTEPYMVAQSASPPQKKDSAAQFESHEPDLSQIPAIEDSQRWDDAGQLEVENPAWTEKSDAIRHYEDNMDELPPPARKTGRWIALVIVVLIVGVIAYFIKFERVRMGNIFDRMLSSQTDDRYKKFFDRGMESFLLDSAIHYKQADREFQKVLALEENHAPTLTALAEMYAVWAQYARDAKLDAETDLNGPNPSSTNQREIDRLTREFEDKLTEAARWAKQAIAADKDSPGPNRAMADVSRLQGDLGNAKLYLEKAKSENEGTETEYVSILIDQDSKQPAEELEERLDALLKEKPLIRAMYRKARITASRGEIAEAKIALGKLFELNSDHMRGRDLAARLDDNKTVAITSVNDSESQGGAASATSDAGAAPVVETQDKDTPNSLKQETPSAQPVAIAQRPADLGAPVGVGGSVDAMILQASKLQENGRTGEALGIYEKVLERSPSNTEALSGMAYCYLDKGDTGRAIASFRRVLGVNSSFGPALLGLAETFKSQGQKEQALKYYKQYLQVKPNGGQSGLAKRNIALLEEAVGSKEVLEQETGTGSQDTPPNQPSSGGEVEVSPTDPGGADKPDQGTPTNSPSEEPKPETPADKPDNTPNPENQASPTEE